MSSWLVTMTQARPLQRVPSCSVMVCRLSMSCELAPMNWPYFIHQKDDLVTGWAGGEVVIDQAGKTFDVDAVVITGAVKPLAGGLG
jgi:hypothetical protein